MTEAQLFKILKALHPSDHSLGLFLCHDIPCPKHLSPTTFAHKLLILHGQSRLNTLGLAEILYRLDRLDLLETVLQISTQWIASHLQNHCPNLISEYRILLAHIYNQLTSFEASNLQFLLQASLKPAAITNAPSFLEFLLLLESLNLLGPSNLQSLQKALTSISRLDLAHKIHLFLQSPHSKWPSKSCIHPTTLQLLSPN
nr:homolog of CASP8 and FADD-like apoptosis regulator [Macronycteris gammaherpesvirus 1]